MARVTFHLRVGNDRLLMHPKLLSLHLNLQHLCIHRCSSWPLDTMVQQILHLLLHLLIVLHQLIGERNQLLLLGLAHSTHPPIGLLQRCLCD